MYFEKKKYIYEKHIFARKEKRVPKLFLVRITAGFLLVAFGISLAGAKVLYPQVVGYSRAQSQKPYFLPVLGYKTSSEDTFSFTELNDFSKKEEQEKRDLPEYFFVTIPKLGIYYAKAKINDESLTPNAHLGHYRQTPLPGELGTSFIYGHASLENYFDPENYLTIFSTLPKLTTGDNFYIYFKDKEYKYLVSKKVTLEPKEVNPYQNYLEKGDLSGAVLMTCVPPGRKDYRLLVVGSLVGIH